MHFGAAKAQSSDLYMSCKLKSSNAKSCSELATSLVFHPMCHSFGWWSFSTIYGNSQKLDACWVFLKSCFSYRGVGVRFLFSPLRNLKNHKNFPFFYWYFSSNLFHLFCKFQSIFLLQVKFAFKKKTQFLLAKLLKNHFCKKKKHAKQIFEISSKFFCCFSCGKMIFIVLNIFVTTSPKYSIIIKLFM